MARWIVPAVTSTTSTNRRHSTRWGEAEYVLYALVLLKEQTFLGVTESEHTGGGHGEGSYRVYRLLRSPQIVSEGLDEV